MLNTNPYVIGPNDNLFQATHPETDETLNVTPQTRMHGELLQIIEGCTIHIEPFVVDGIGSIRQPQRINAPTIDGYNQRHLGRANKGSDKWLRSFVCESDTGTYTCTIDFYDRSIILERQPADEKKAAKYKILVSRFIPDAVTYADGQTHINLTVLIDFVTTLVSPFEKHNKLYALAKQMHYDVLLISNKQNSKNERLEALDRLREDLKTCIDDPDLDELTSIYRDTKPSTLTNTGYDQVAVSKFIAKMGHIYSNRRESPIAGNIRKHAGVVDLNMIQTYGLNIGENVINYDLTYVSQCTGIAKSTLSSLRTGNKSIDSLTIATASLLTQIGEVYYLKQLKEQLIMFDKGSSSTAWSFDIYTTHVTKTVDYVDEHTAQNHRNDVINILTGGQSRVLKLGSERQGYRQAAMYLSGHQHSVGTLHGVSEIYTTKKGDM